MSLIKIDSVYDETRVAKQSGKSYQVTVVKGTKYDTGESWEQPIFKNNKQVLAQLFEFGKGDIANFKYEKNGKFFDLISVEVPDKALIDSIVVQNAKTSGEVPDKARVQGTVVQDAPTPPKFTGKSLTSGSGMSKEDWAEKDRLTNIRIAKAVAIKLACENTKVGSTPASLISMAEEFVPWLLDTDGGSVEVSPEDSSDSLDPPVED